MKRMAAGLTTAALLLVPVAEAGARQNRIEGSFTAEALPLPQAVGWPSSCTSLAPWHTNVDGVNRVVEPLRAPFSGWLSIEAIFSGDWDLALLDEEGKALAWSFHQFYPYTEEREMLSYFVRKGQKVGIAVCNVLSGSPAEVRYVLEASRPWRAPAGRDVQRRTEERRYIAPSVGTKDLFVICHWAYEVGCPESVATRPSDRFVSVEISDASAGTISDAGAGAISAQVYQYSTEPLTYLDIDSFCTSTDDPIPLKPGTTGVGVLILMGPCEDGTPATATRGTYSVTLSNRR